MALVNPTPLSGLGGIQVDMGTDRSAMDNMLAELRMGNQMAAATLARSQAGDGFTPFEAPFQVGA